MDVKKIHTPHFTLQEMIKSNVAEAKGIDNTPSTDVVLNLLNLMTEILEPARVKLDVPIIVTSGYRSEKLNKAVGGVTNSQHLLGQAADLICKRREDKLNLFKILSKMDVDQLLFETNKSGTTWVHVSYNKGKNRHYINDNYKV